MSGKIWWCRKASAKLLPHLVILPILSANIPLDFHDSVWVVPLKYLMCF